MVSKIFIHGLESNNQGTKSVFFRKLFPSVIIPHFKGSLKGRMKKLNGVLAGRSRIQLVGSSFGGLMATIFAMENEPRVDRVVLLAPALNLIGFSNCEQKEIGVPVRIYHGTEDGVIPLEGVEHMAKKLFRDCSFHRVEDDHFLHRTFKVIDWMRLLGE